MFFQLQKFVLVEYSLLLTERSFFLALCSNKYSILNLFSCLLYPLTNLGQLGIDSISAPVQAANEEDVEDEKDVLPVQIY